MYKESCVMKSLYLYKLPVFYLISFISSMNRYFLGLKTKLYIRLHPDQKNNYYKKEPLRNGNN